MSIIQQRIFGGAQVPLDTISPTVYLDFAPNATHHAPPNAWCAGVILAPVWVATISFCTSELTSGHQITIVGSHNAFAKDTFRVPVLEHGIFFQDKLDHHKIIERNALSLVQAQHQIPFGRHDPPVYPVLVTNEPWTQFKVGLTQGWGETDDQYWTNHLQQTSMYLLSPRTAKHYLRGHLNGERFRDVVIIAGGRMKWNQVSSAALNDGGAPLLQQCMTVDGQERIVVLGVHEWRHVIPDHLNDKDHTLVFNQFVNFAHPEVRDWITKTTMGEVQIATCARPTQPTTPPPATTTV